MSRRPSMLPAALLCAVSGLSLLALVGWALGEHALASLIPGQPAMKLNTAAAFLLLSAGVGGLLIWPAQPLARMLGVACGVVVLALGITVAAEHLTGWQSGIGELLGRDVIARRLGGGTPGRFVPPTAVGFVCCGLALTMHAVGVRWRGVVSVPALGACCLGAASAISLAARAPQVVDGVSVLMAPTTAAAFMAIGVSIVLSRPECTVGRLLSDPGPARSLLRSGLPAGVLVPVGAGVLDATVGLDLTNRLGVNIFVVGTIAGLLGLLIALAAYLDRQDHARRKALEGLQASERQTAAILRSSAQAFVSIDEHGTIIECNPSAEQTLGFARDELLGRPLAQTLIPERFRAAHAEGLKRFLGGGERRVLDQRLELFALRGDGREIPIEMTITAVLGEEGWRFHAFMSDISERVARDAELERERRDLQEAQAIALLGCWDYDLAGNRPGRWSAEMWRMLGLTPQPVAPPLPEWLAMVHPDDRPRVTERMAQLDIRDPFSDEFRLLAADGRVLHVAFRADVVRDEHDQPVSAFGTVQDVTDRAQHDAEQRALRNIAELVADGAGPAEVFSAAAGHVRDLFDAHTGAITRFDEAAGQGSVVSGRTAEGDTLAGSTFDLDGVTASAEVFRTGRAARVDSPRAGPDDPAAATIAKLGAIGVVAAPIIVAGRLWGTLGAAFDQHATPPDAELRLERFARLVAMAIANADAWDTLSRQAATDPLTALANHRTFHDRLRSEVQRARRYERDLSVVLLDLDHFKDVNDAHGHQVGDRVLAEVARRLGAEARDGELVARIGGEEFAWLMPETGQHGAYQAADRARRAIESQPFETVGTVTISAGVCASHHGLDGDDLVRFADRALYWAKDGGRNTTFLYTQEAHALLARETRQVERFQTMSSVRALARAIDSKDPSTRQHSERVASLAERLALHLGWTAKRARLLHACGLLHDVGKIGIPDTILLKPGPLTDIEYEQIKRHAEMSAQIAAEVLEDEQVAWIRGHHERWDGNGYPDRIAGEQIPDGARILALADAWDVMTQNRTYKPTKPADEAIIECRAQAGRQFAPAAVDALLAVIASTAQDEPLAQRPTTR